MEKSNIAVDLLLKLVLVGYTQNENVNDLYCPKLTTGNVKTLCGVVTVSPKDKLQVPRILFVLKPYVPVPKVRFFLLEVLSCMLF